MKNNQDFGNAVKKWMGIILYLAVALEMIFFPSWQNFCGCIMSLICWGIFQSFFLKRDLILEHPFAFAMFFSMFLYRYLPLIATLIEGKPITYGFERAYQTFFFETLLFGVSALAFHFACSTKKKQNNFIQQFFYSAGFFNNNVKIFLGLGFVGIVARLYVYAQGYGDITYGDVFGKFMSGVICLMYVPLCLLFPTLLRINVSTGTKRIVEYYTVFIFLLNFATNSRMAILTPIATLILLFLLHVLKDNINIKNFISPTKMVMFAVLFVFGLSFLSEISLAMLANRGIRQDIKWTTLINETIETYQDERMMQILRSELTEEIHSTKSYSEGWDEAYLDNFMLNRYGNMRITDETLYHANKMGWMNKKMQDDFFTQLWKLLPTPLLTMLNISIDKEKLEYSRGDILASEFLGGYRVTSHVGDGLSTFGYWYFPIQCILFFFVFKLLDCFVFYSKSGIIYSALGLVNIFTFLGLFRNAGGCLSEAGFCIRGFWQLCVVYLMFFVIIKKVLFIKFK
jgi:hypothetical protein